MGDVESGFSTVLGFDDCGYPSNNSLLRKGIRGFAQADHKVPRDTNPAIVLALYLNNGLKKDCEIDGALRMFIPRL
jgi:hypothetical protein